MISGTAIRKLEDSVDHNADSVDHNADIFIRWMYSTLYECNEINKFRMQQTQRRGVFFPGEIRLGNGAEMNNETFKECIAKIVMG